MKKEVKIRKYLETFYPGILFPERTITEIEERNPLRIKQEKRATGFRFFDVSEIVADGKILTGKRENVSGIVYFGQIKTAEEIIARYENDPSARTLISNIRINETKKLVICDNGTITELGDNDTTMDELLAKSKKEDKETIAKEMFNKLRQHIGNTVTYTGFWYGAQQEETDILKSVEDFVNVQIGCTGIPFIGYGAAIKTITSQNGELLYENIYLEENYDRRKSDEIFAAKRNMFGDSIVDEEEAKLREYERESQEATEKANKEAKKNKYKYMLMGLKEVKPDLVLEWLEFVDKNTNDAYSSGVILATIDVMKRLSKGRTCKFAEKVYSDLGLTGFMAGATTNAVAHFHKTRADEFRNYWNAQWGITTEEKGVVNPAVLTIKQQTKNNS